MSSSNSIRLKLNLPNVDVFTFGESTLYGGNSLNSCLIVVSLNELNNLNDQSINYLHLSISLPNPIQQLIVNQDETILAIICEKTAYLVYLPPSPVKGSRQCSVNTIPCSTINNSLIDLLWLSPTRLVVVNSHPSPSECHLYLVGRSKTDGIKHIQTFSVGSSLSKVKANDTPTKKISLNQPSDIVKLSLVKRKQDDSIRILLFALKSDGNLFLMEIDENELLSNEIYLSSSFIGPIRLIPSTPDNYGAGYSHSRLVCLSHSDLIIVSFTHDKCEITQCIYLNPSIDDYKFYAIDSIKLPTNENNQRIKSLTVDRLNSNIYYTLDSLSNIYSIELSWTKQTQKSDVQHLVKSNYFIYQFGLIQTNNKSQYLAIITKTDNQQDKELIFVRPHCLSVSLEISSNSSLQSISQHPSLEFVDYIRTILHREQSLPQLTLSSASSTNISDQDFQQNIVKFLQIFSGEYLQKQEKARNALENKQHHLHNFQQTHIVAQQELNLKFQQIRQTFQNLNERYQQECLRRRELSTNVDDLLSVIQQHTPIVSDSEVLMHRQLTKYHIQINCLREKISCLSRFISSDQNSNPNQQQVNQKILTDLEEFVKYYKDEIGKMKQRIQNLSRNN